MLNAKRVFLAAAVALSVIGAIVIPVTKSKAAPSGGNRVFEMRTYYTLPGRLDALNARFRDHTCGLFKKHGMDLVGFWTPRDEEKGKANTLVYLLAYPSREAAKVSWKAFHEDEEWKKASKESEKDGKIVERVESVFLDPTDYSAIK